MSKGSLAMTGLLLLLFALEAKCGEVAKTASVDEMKTLKFTFHLFENFEATKEVYLKEAELVEHLKNAKEELTKQAKELKSILKRNQDGGQKFDANSFLKTASSLREFLNKTNQELQNVTADFPTKLDYQGAKHGLTLLHYTYYINMTAACLDHKLEYFVQNQLHSEPTFEKLTLHDLETLVKTAIERNKYNTAILIVTEMVDLMPKLKLTKEEVKSFKKKISTWKKDLSRINNGYLEKTKSFIDSKFEVLTYEVDKNLLPKKKQPEHVKNGQVYSLQKSNDNTKQWIFLRVCQQGRIFGGPKPNTFCRFLHHKDPYLKLGPFKEDHISDTPYAVVFRDILSDNEMEYLKDVSRPNLSRQKVNLESGGYEANAADYRSGQKRRIIHKTVQAWLKDVTWPDTSIDVDHVGKNYINVTHLVLWKLAKKIQLATQMKTDSHYSSTEMQVTNYGLGGLCETHADPFGIMEVGDIPEARKHLLLLGDMIGTFMAWLDHVQGGGGTAYVTPGKEGLIMPERGSAAFWYDLHSDGIRDQSATHGGCPIIKGSKWILNKWMYMYDNFQRFPCHLKRKTPISPPEKSNYFLP